MKTQQSAVDVATYITKQYRVTGNLQLQKLVYYAEAWAQVWGGPLFDEQVEAWDKGPVVRSVWDVDYTMLRKRELPQLSDNVRSLLDAVIPFYNKHHGASLMRRTHQEAPWVDAYSRGRNAEIARSTMKRYYAKQAILCPDDVPSPPEIHYAPLTDKQIEQQAERLSTKWRRTLEILAQ